MNLLIADSLTKVVVKKGMFKHVSLTAGSGRVTFNNQRSYLKAVSAAFVEIKTPKFTKKVRRASIGHLH